MKLKLFGLISSLAAFSLAAPYPDDGSQSALSFAYMYGFPLYAFSNVAKPLLAKGIPLKPNVIIASPEPNEPGAVGVVRPNADTIYSIMFIDLSSQNLRVTIPEIPGDRYWVFPVCTPYGDNLVNLGNLGASEPGVRQDVGNDWYIVAEEYIGRFDSFYAMRYQIGLTAYLALVQSESAYPFYGKVLSVGEGQSVLCTFTKPPKIRDGGFWSLTAYGPDQDLIENDLEKYMVGDRSNLTFPDGTPVEEGDDRPFRVLLQAEDIPPPANCTNNWLPINSGGGNISVTLRWYGAEEEMVDGTYFHPKMEFIDAIKA
ncbi:hypothetical protein ACHAP7_003443 [Fusarium lateritium]